MDDQALLRYSRQILLDDIDIEGQTRLLNAQVLIVGLGGLGSPAALYLAACGIGQLTLIDHDTVEITNLQRQIAHTEASIGSPKADSARDRMHAINSQTRIRTLNHRLTETNLRAEVEAADVVLDCTDNLDTRFALNAACAASQTPLVSGAAIRWEAQISVFHTTAGGACYQCLYRPGQQTPQSCNEAGVVAPLVGIVGAVQALEAVKLITGAGKPLQNRLLLLDAKSLQWREVQLQRDPDCEICSNSAIKTSE